MQSFKEQLSERAALEEEYAVLLEKLITFKGRSYPRFGNVVILAGGAGSGKGFVKDKLLGIEGYSFDVDELKRLVASSEGIAKRVKEEMGIDVAQLASNMKDPSNVAKLHEIVAEFLNMDNKRQRALFTSILSTDPERKPNLIFDVTLKNLDKLDRISSRVHDLGYKKENIHIVWIVNDIAVALDQNAKRSRTVPTEILMNTHRGVSQTMRQIFTMGSKLSRYMDGDLVLAFNKAGVDNTYIARAKGDTRREPGQGMKDANMYSNGGKYSGGYFDAADYVYLKRAGQRITDYEKIKKSVIAKIASYVPKSLDWI